MITSVRSLPKRGQTTAWIGIDEIRAMVALPEGYRLDLVKPTDIAALVRAIRSWYPDISVGTASRYLREEYYGDNVLYESDAESDAEKDVLVVLIRKGRALAGVFSCERDQDSLALYARLAVIAPTHRGAGLGQCCILLAEAIGRRTGMGLVYGMATLKVPYVQMAFERLGWQLIGIAPGYDRELVAPGVVKRVYEALYAKVLVQCAALARPAPHGLTPRTRAFFDRMFPQHASEPA